MKTNTPNSRARLKRIEGQVRGIQQMLEEDRYCVDFLTQTGAARSALKAVESLTLKYHARCCVDDVMEREGPTAQHKKLKDLIQIVMRHRG